ncbi:MAG: hypothetical protein ACOCPM_02540 [Bacteroidales bacterium]
MKIIIRVVVFVTALLLTTTLFAQQDNRYSFGFGINTLDPTTSKVFRAGYSHKIKPKVSIGLTASYSIDETNFYIASSYEDPVSAFIRGREFAFENLLKNELDVGQKKLNSLNQINHEYLFAPTVNFHFKKKRLEFSPQLGLGVLFYNVTGVGTYQFVKTRVKESEEELIILYSIWNARSISFAFLVDLKMFYHFNNDMFLGLSTSIDYDPIVGGFPFKSVITFGQRF